jgi:putative endonuclease
MAAHNHQGAAMKSLGDSYEERAARWLARQGLRIVERNFRIRAGEIDIVARDGDCLVFVEVRARSHPRFAGAAASVDHAKQRRLLQAAALYLQARPQLARLPCRFDVIAFEPRQSGPGAELRWIRQAFTA